MPSGRRAAYSGSMKIARAQVACGAVPDERAWRQWDRTQPYGGCPSPEFIVANLGVDLEAKDGWLVVRIEGEQDTYVPVGQVLWVEPITTESRHRPDRLLGETCDNCGLYLNERHPTESCINTRRVP